MVKTIRVVIADDHTIFRQGLKTLLSGDAGISVVGEAGDGHEAAALVESLQPDILLLDLAMPAMHGMDVLKALAGGPSQVRTIVLSGDISEEEIGRAFNLGACGVLMKDSDPEMLARCIRAVMGGQYWAGKKCADSREQILSEKEAAAPQEPQKDFGLTRRELEVIQVVAAGNSNKEIAAILSISEQTVKHHITSIFDKLGVFNRLELTLFALHHNLAAK